MNFANKAVVVTGSSFGMGRDMAVAFAKRGAAVVVNYASSEDKARETLRLIEKEGGRGILCRGDVSRVEDCDRLAQTCLDEYGRLDVLVNNAGCTSFVPFQDLEAVDETSWRHIMDVNVMGTFFCSRAAARAMRAAGHGGSIISLSSVAGHRANGSSIPYCTSKAAILHLSRCLAKAVGPDIRVNTVSPGFIADTGWHTHRQDADLKAVTEGAGRDSLLQRVGVPADITGAVLFLASEQSSFCTGIDLLVDGGRFFFV